MPSSLGRTGSNSLAAMLAANPSLGGGGGAGGGGYPYASLPGTPSSGSRPGSARAGSRAARPPAALLVDAVRSKDERKLEDTLEVLRGPQGNVQGELGGGQCGVPACRLLRGFVERHGNVVKALYGPLPQPKRTENFGVLIRTGDA